MNNWLLKKLLQGSISAVLLSSSSVIADVSYTPAAKNPDGSFVVSKIRIYNSINKGDAKQFHAMVVAAKQRAKDIRVDFVESTPVMVLLNSTGGSVDDAIAIGQEIRAIAPMTVNVEEGAICGSACVFILAGAPSRNVWGRIGIHRPYVEFDDALTPEAQRQRYVAMEKRIKQYLESVNVPTSLYDTMFRIPPEKVRYLTLKEMQDFNLNEDDPYYKESRDAWWAKKLGLSKSEYTSRMAACNRLQTDQATIDCLDNLAASKNTKAGPTAPPPHGRFTPLQ